MQLQPDLANKPEVRALMKDATALLDEAAALRITSDAGYVTAADQLKSIKGKQKELKSLRETITKPINAALKATRELFSKPEDTLDSAEAILKTAMSTYDEETERQRREQQRKLDEQAEKERQKLLAKADRAAAKGDADESLLLNERAAMVVAPIVQQETPKVAGIARRENWRAEVFDMRALVRAVADGKVPLAAIEANRTFLNGQARALRAELQYPGVRAVQEKSFAAGSA